MWQYSAMMKLHFPITNRQFVKKSNEKEKKKLLDRITSDK